MTLDYGNMVDSFLWGNAGFCLMNRSVLFGAGNLGSSDDRGLSMYQKP